MKKILFVVVLLVLFLTLSSLSTTADWVYYGADILDNTYFYDRESISFPSKGVVRVWTKRLSSEEGKMYMITKMAKSNLTTDGYNEYSHTLCQKEIKCVAKESANLACADYSNSGNVLDRYDTPKNLLEWLPVYPESMLEALWKAVCKRKGK